MNETRCLQADISNSMANVTFSNQKDENKMNQIF